MKLTKSKFQKRILLGVFLFLILVLSLFSSRILIFNLTESLPLGLWGRTPLNIERGGVVGFCPQLPESVKNDYRLKASENGMVRICDENVQMLMKPVVAVPGDRVEIKGTKIFVNEKFIAERLERDGYGKHIESVKPGIYNVKAGEYWMISTYNKASFDSRYFGAIKAEKIKYSLVPLFVNKSKKFCWNSQQYKCL
ncbi:MULTISPECIES: signal peptidase I [unclassified Acinetobacter]|uniref:signal peptidase I n=1 Tax=unclassified Acinetobacter TaxID=196816 RepID=UPI0015D1133B|nr:MULTISPECIES: signal peptidase I [unclassified Acinetobacter]UUS62520.1 signal peptidase I [Acinetobacter sp. YH16056_T]